MKTMSELREGERFYLQAPVLIEDNRTGYRYDGTMFNYSASGMYLESDYAPRPGRKLRLNIEKSPYFSSNRNYLAEVRWRQPNKIKASAFAYRIGVKYL